MKKFAAHTYVCVFVYIKTYFLLKSFPLVIFQLESSHLGFFFFTYCFDLSCTSLSWQPDFLHATKSKSSLTEVTSVSERISGISGCWARHHLTLLKAPSSARHFYYFTWNKIIWRNVCARANRTASDCIWLWATTETKPGDKTN